MAKKRNPNLGPSPMRAKKRRLFYIRSLIVIFFLSVILISSAILSDHQKVQIKEIIIVDNAAVSNNEITSIVESETAGRYWYLFSKNNILIFPRFQIKKAILADIKTIQSVKVSWNTWNSIKIKVVERKPHAVWCGETPDSSNEDCLFLDQKGYAFSTTSNTSGSVFVKNYGSTPKLGETFMSVELYNLIYNLIKTLDLNNIKVVTFFYDGFDFRFYLNTGPIIIFNDKNNLSTLTSFDSAFQNLFSAINSGNLDLINGAEEINYIDLRFGDKVVVGKKENK